MIETPRDIDLFRTMLEMEPFDLEISVDAPANPSGEWWIDLSITLDQQSHDIQVLWKEGLGFGLYTSNDSGYGDRPHEMYTAPEIAAARLSQQLHQLLPDGELVPLWLGDLRKLCGQNQTDLALRMDIRQAAISRVENREDVRLATLRSYVEALGGKLEIWASFEEFQARLSPSNLS